MKFYKSKAGDFINLDLVNRVYVSYHIKEMVDIAEAPLAHFKIVFRVNFLGYNFSFNDEFTYNSKIETLRAENEKWDINEERFDNTNKEQANQYELVQKMAEEGVRRLNTLIANGLENIKDGLSAFCNIDFTIIERALDSWGRK